MSYYLGFSCLSNIEATKKRNLNTEKKQEISKYILTRFYDKPIEKIDIRTEAGGRPFVNEKDIDFNISNSGHLTAITFVNGANLRTGCDIECLRHRAGAAEIAANYFSCEEREYLFYSGKFDETRFYEIWTLKECYIKLRGLSVFDMANSPSFIKNGEFVFGSSVSLPVSFRLYELSDKATGKRYMLSTVIEGSQQQPEITWFSQYTLDCKTRAEINVTPDSRYSL